ncbi:MAG: YgiQ family radical SAM protein [Nanobdellota archaeon]
MYDVILVIGELFFDHPLSGAAIIKRLLEREGYKVGVIEKPEKPDDVKRLGRPRLFFGVSSGSIDSMIRNYTPLKKRRDRDKHSDYDENVKDRALIVYTNWIKQSFRDVKIVLGGTESTLRRFVHYDYWQNRLRKPIIFDAKADILVYGNGEKQTLEIADRINKGNALVDIKGTCIISRDLPDGFEVIPGFEEIRENKDRFIDAQRMFSNGRNLAQKIDNRYLLQYESPVYTSSDLDHYYSMHFTRKIPNTLKGFEFSVVTHRGCIGNCSFCALRLIQGDKIISRSEGSILDEIKGLTEHPDFKGTIDDLGGPTANMYGMDCNLCNGNCIDCSNLKTDHNRLLSLLRKARKIKGVKRIHVRSGIRFDLATKEYIKELVGHDHIINTLRIAPEHTDRRILKLMNKDRGDLDEFIRFFRSLDTKKELSFYFITAHPGSSLKEARKLSNDIKRLKNSEDIQIFIPAPMTDSTCMYYTGKDLDKNEIHVPYTYREKKEQKRILYSN